MQANLYKTINEETINYNSHNNNKTATDKL